MLVQDWLINQFERRLSGPFSLFFKVFEEKSETFSVLLSIEPLRDGMGCRFRCLRAVEKGTVGVLYVQKNDNKQFEINTVYCTQIHNFSVALFLFYFCA